MPVPAAASSTENFRPRPINRPIDWAIAVDAQSGEISVSFDTALFSRACQNGGMNWITEIEGATDTGEVGIGRARPRRTVRGFQPRFPACDPARLKGDDFERTQEYRAAGKGMVEVGDHAAALSGVLSEARLRAGVVCISQSAVRQYPFDDAKRISLGQYSGGILLRGFQARTVTACSFIPSATEAPPPRYSMSAL